jgi:tyrosyl-tRNA synthetase
VNHGGRQARIIQLTRKSMKVFEDLERRGLVKQVTDAEKVRKLLESESPITFYIGFDPTADSLHVGHLLQIVTAKRLADAGHKPIMLIGGATALIGDPTGKSKMRKMLSHSDIRVNSEAIAGQIQKIMGKDCEIVSNLQWFDDADFLTVLRTIGPFFSVNEMLRAECFKSRMEHGLSFLEFNYMIMQAQDFRMLHLDEGCVLQIGGDDQWSNILAGIHLLHKKHQAEVFGLTLPLLVNSDGTKMGKTEKGAVWLDPDKTSPFDFFQFWRNIEDAKVKQCINFFTTKTVPVFSEVSDEFGDFNKAKKFLAFEVTKLVHGETIAQQALEQAEALFEKRNASDLVATSISEGTHILEMIIKCGFARSRTEARNLILNRGITINQEVLTDPTVIVSKNNFGNELIVQKGKKHFCRLLIEDKCLDQIP